VPFEPGLQVGARVVREALQRGVILRPVGDTIVLCPPLAITRSEFDLLFDAVTDALDAVAATMPGRFARVA
jgi:adenosylmethionine-8-amino-7-oxononanoate aminotransferase